MNEQVLCCGKLWEKRGSIDARADVVEACASPALPVNGDATVGWLDHAEYRIKQRGFAGTIQP